MWSGQLALPPALTDPPQVNPAANPAAATEHMQVQMKHRLSSVSICIHDRTVTGLGNAFAARHLRAGGHYLGNQLGITGLKRIHRLDMSCAE